MEEVVVNCQENGILRLLDFPALDKVWITYYDCGDKCSKQNFTYGSWEQHENSIMIDDAKSKDQAIS